MNLIETCLAMHDLRVVGLAALVCIVGSVMSFRILDARVPLVERAAMVGAVGGGSIWATHFIAIMGLQPVYNTGFRTLYTFSCLPIVVFGFAIAVFAYDRLSGPVRFLSAGVILSLGVAAMHYTGMLGIASQHFISYDVKLLIWSVVLSVVFFTAAFVAGSTPIPAAVLLSLGVIALHFGGMTSTEFGPARPEMTPFYLDRALILMATSLVTVFLFFAAVIYLFSVEVRVGETEP